MKKLFSFLLFVFVIFSANNISFADEVIPFNKSFFAYNEPSFTSAKGNGGVQYGPQKALTVKEKRSDGWWKIGTWEGDKWINTDGELKTFDKPFLAFYEPSFASQKGNMEIPYSSNTTVRVIDGNTAGWLKFQSWEGDKWMYPGVAETVVLDKSFYSYNEPSLIATKGAGGNQFGPQKFLPILEKRPDGWWKTVTYEGPKWIAPDGIKMPVNANFTTFDEPYLEAKKSSGFGPQKNLVAYDGKKTEQGDFYLVGTYLGQKWMSLNGEKEFNEKREPMRQELGYNETTFDFNTLDVQKSETAALRAAEGKNPSGENLKIPTKEEREEFLKNNNTNVRSASQSARSLPANWVHKGDVIYTPNSYGGIAGHSAIVVKDFTETQNFPGALKGAYIIAQAPGIGENPAVQINALEEWEFNHHNKDGSYQKYHTFYYMRHVDSRTSIKAADYAYNHFYQNRYNYKYNIFASSANSNDKYTYCSKLVYLSFRDGAGVDLFSNKNKYIVHPADFLLSKQLIMYFRGDGGSWG